jgi:hydroxymethylbilane synthase
VQSADRKHIRVGTRESKLALLQTNMIIEVCRERFPNHSFEIVPLSTSGDKVLNKPIAELGTTGVFVKELEEALLENRVDFVVHSLKDVPTAVPDGLVIAATLLRDDPRDVFVSRGNVRFEDLPPGSRVATSSRRRAAQLQAVRKDLKFVDVRGNVPTRLRKLDEDQCDGMVLAAAGLLRLGFEERIAHYFPPAISVPAAGQGALGVECRAGDVQVESILAQIDDAQVRAEIMAERAFLGRMGGGCSVPIGVLGRLREDGVLHLAACVADGNRIITGEKEGTASGAASLGLALAEEMLKRGAAEILESIMQKPQQPISPP